VGDSQFCGHRSGTAAFRSELTAAPPAQELQVHIGERYPDPDNQPATTITRADHSHIGSIHQPGLPSPRKTNPSRVAQMTKEDHLHNRHMRAFVRAIRSASADLPLVSRLAVMEPCRGITLCAAKERFSLSHKRRRDLFDPHIWSIYPKAVLDLPPLELWLGLCDRLDYAPLLKGG
jgi:hypothetical protein